MHKIIIILLLVVILVPIFRTNTTTNSDWYDTAISNKKNTPIRPIEKTTVALIDSGINPNNTHLWTNPFEMLDHADSDNNGYIDDIHGWNYVNNSNNITDTNGHGTVMASLIADVNPNVTIIPLVVLDSQNQLVSINALVKAIYYAIAERVNLIVIAIYFGTLRDSVGSAVNTAIQKNIAVITSSGNYGVCSCNAQKENALASVE